VPGANYAVISPTVALRVVSPLKAFKALFVPGTNYAVISPTVALRVVSTLKAFREPQTRFVKARKLVVLACAPRAYYFEALKKQAF